MSAATPAPPALSALPGWLDGAAPDPRRLARSRSGSRPRRCLPGVPVDPGQRRDRARGRAGIVQRRERGQASIELLAALPFVFVAALLCLQLLAAGYSLTLADGAVEAGAIALASDLPARAGGRGGAPGLGPRPGRPRAHGRAAGAQAAPALAARGPRAGARGELERLGAATGWRCPEWRRSSSPASSRAAGGGLAWAAAVAIALAREADGARLAGGDGAVLLVEVGAERARGPTMLAADRARELERELRAAGFEAAARGRLGWARIAAEEGWIERVGEALELCAGTARAAVVSTAAGADPGGARRRTARRPRRCCCGPSSRASARSRRSRWASSAPRGLRTRIAPRAAGRVATRRALAGIDPGGEASRRSARLARGLLGAGRRARASPGPAGARLAADAGQALPLVLGRGAGAGPLHPAARGPRRCGDRQVAGAARGRPRGALGGALDARRLRAPVRAGPAAAAARPNPAHLGKAEYLARAAGAAAEAAARETASTPAALRVEFPDAGSFAPLRVRAEVDAPSSTTRRRPAARPGRRPPPRPRRRRRRRPGPAARRRWPPAAATRGRSPTARASAMRPDVAAAFDRLAAAARGDGHRRCSSTPASAPTPSRRRCSPQNPDPRWVAPPGTSLHRCATELDLGPPAAYGWLAAQRPRASASCSATRGRPGTTASSTARRRARPRATRSARAAPRRDGGGRRPASLPAFVPARFRAPIAARGRALERLRGAARRAADGRVELQPVRGLAGRRPGIAQFMPGTAARLRPRRPVRRRRRDRRPGAPDVRPAAPVRLARSPSPPTTPARRPVAACDCVPRSPRPRPTSPASSACSTAPAPVAPRARARGAAGGLPLPRLRCSPRGLGSAW